VSSRSIATLPLRHRIAVTFVALAAGALSYHLIHANPGYMDSGSVAFTAPRNSVTMFQDIRSLQVAGEVTAQYMMDRQGEQEVRAAGGTAPYNVAMLNIYNEEFPDYNQPYVTITVMSDYPQAAQQTFGAVLGVLRKATAMVQEQVGANPENEVKATLVAAPTGPVAQGGSHKRSYAACGVLTIIAMYLVAGILDRRRRRPWPDSVHRFRLGSGRHAATALHTVAQAHGLAGVFPVQDETPCKDLIVTIRSLSRALRTVRTVRSVLSSTPYAVPGHFYSPLTSHTDTDRAATWAERAGSAAPGVDMAVDRQLALRAEIAEFLDDPLPGPRYDPDNTQYGAADAAVYRAMLNCLRPERVVEVGSGFSTAILLDEIDRNLPGTSVTCVEPFPERLFGLMSAADHGRLTVYRKPVQDVPLDVYRQLSPGDVLFIDSTHVVKAGSDVNWLFLHVLPRLATGVAVHVHDVFWPFEYPKKWLAEHRDWTEDYLLHAFLIGNTGWEIMLFSSWLWRSHPELVPARLAGHEPGSIWLRRVG
jgi:predicted O-methyltransferase YrrM